MEGNWQAIIAGAGIVGAAVARELHRAGWRVLVLDEAAPGGGATAACMGHVVVMDDNDAQMNLTLMSRRLWDAEAATLPADCSDERSGTLWVAADEEELAGAARRAEYYARFGVETELVDRAGLRRLEPNLSPELVGGMRVPSDRVVYPTNCVRQFLRGIEFQRGRVKALRPQGLELEDGRVLEAPVIINALGARSATFMPELPVEPRKGHLAITDRYAGFIAHQIVELGYLKSAHGFDPESVAFNVQPRPNGQVIIGSAREFVGFDDTINERILAKMMKRALHYMPALDQLQVIRVWTGLRPASRDGLPFIGAWPCVPGHYVASGHEGLGITTSLGTAQLLADELLGRRPAIDPAPYRAKRIFEEGYHAGH